MNRRGWFCRPETKPLIQGTVFVFALQRYNFFLNLQTFSLFFCRGDPARTGDHLVPNQVRYQLRYTPALSKSGAKVGLF